MSSEASKPVDQPDVLIVGGGIAGLYTAREILQRQPKTQLLLIEKYPVLGGRVLSFRKQIAGKEVGWEAGAGRLHYSQKRVHKLLDEYGITVIPLSASADYLPDCQLPRRQDNNFSSLAAAILPLLAALPPAELQMQTLADVCRRIMGPVQSATFLNKFPYHTEVHRLRADMALDAFRSVMGADAGFCTVRGGFAQIPLAIAADIRRSGGTIWLGASLERWSGSGGSTHPLKATVRLSRPDKTNPVVTIHPKRMILALHSGALQAFPQTRNWAPMKHLGVAKLLRIYAVFPKNKLCNGTKGPWFAGMSKVVTPGPLRYVIPISEEAGTIMISYTDGDDTAPFWSAAQEADGGSAGATGRLTKLIMTHVRRLFGSHIPNPTFIKAHPWTVGSTYWKPGRYDVDNVIKESRQLQSGVFVIGESFSKEQAWIEGALESADGFLQDFYKRN